MTTDEKTALENLNGAADPQARYSAIIAIGKASLTGLESAIAPYIEDPDPELRSAAIRTLAFYWRLPQYRSVAERMMREEPDAQTRSVAVMAWAGYDIGTKNRETLRRLYEIVVDEAEPPVVRDQAYLDFFAVYLPTAVGRPKSAYRVGRRFDDEVEWERLDAAMLDAGVDPLKPKGARNQPNANDLTAAEVVRIISGQGRVAGSRFGRVELEIESDDTFRARHETGRARRSWRGRLTPGTFKRALGEMKAAGFPNVAPIRPLPPGAAPRELGWELRSGNDSALLADDDRSFDELDTIFSSILAVLDPVLARLPSGVTTAVIEQHQVDES